MTIRTPRHRIARGRRHSQRLRVWTLALACSIVASPVAAQVVSGGYTGDGSDNVPIAQHGFQPDVVIVKGNTTQTAVIRTSTMIGDLAKPMTGATALTANLIQSLDSRGFTIGSDASVNGNAVEYSFVAFKQAAKRMKVGTYTGSGGAQNITGVGFSPELVVIIPANAAEVLYRSSADTETFNFGTSAGSAQITALGADGFSVAAALSGSGTAYHYIAWNDVPGVMDVAAYTGNGTDGTNRTEPGFRPEFVIVKRDGASGAVFHAASQGAATDTSSYFTAAANVTNRIQQLRDDGFQIGTGAEVNTNRSDYHYFAWRRTLADMQVLSGSYVGNGVDNRAITGLGFPPDMVLIKGNNTQYAAIRFWTNYGDITGDVTGAAVANLIQSLDAEGFTVGTDARVNASGITYNWVAWQRGAGQMEVGQYTGNGTSGRAITDLGFSPDFVIVGGYVAEIVYHNAASTNSYSFLGNTSASWITALGTDGFTVGNDGRVNSSGFEYAWVAFDEIPGLMDVGSYTGNGADNRNITGVGFLPQFVLTQSGVPRAPAAHSIAMGTSTDASHYFTQTANAANEIQALQTDGFQVGSGLQSNEDARTFVYAAWATNLITAVDMVRMSAERTGQGVKLEWRTGYETSNFGFHIYHEENGQRVRLTTSPVRGASLLLGPASQRMNGFAYRWTDTSAGPESITYWIEDLDLNGTATLHGPIVAPADVEKGAANAPAGWIAGEWFVPPAGKNAAAALSAALPRTPSGPAAAPSAPAAAGTAKAYRAAPAPASSAASSFDAATGVVRVPLPPSRRVERAAPMPIDVVRRGERPIVSPEMRAQWRVAGQPAARIRVRTAGWYRVTQPQLIAAGIDPAADPRLLRLFVNGVEQPMIVGGESDGRLDAGDFVEFYGEGTDTPYADNRIYWLVPGDTPGARMSADQTAPRGTPAPGSFPHSIEKKERVLYFAALLNGEPENFFGELISGEFPTEQALHVSHLDRAGARTARLEVQLQGVTEDAESGNHDVAVTLNGHPVGHMRFSGRGLASAAWDLDVSWLLDGENIVALHGASEFDYTLVDVIRLTYMRTYAPDNGRLRATIEGGRDVAIGPFDSSGIRLLDITDAGRPRELIGEIQPRSEGFFVRAAVSGRGQRTLLALTADGVLAPVSITANAPSAWHRDAAGRDVVMISHAAFIPSLQRLKAFREQQRYRVALVDVEDVYDEFSFGEKTPFALRRFLAHTHRATVKPRYVLLVGNAVDDPRDYYGFGEPDYVPTKMVATTALEAASDDWFADADADGHAELGFVGRLPVRTAEEATAVVGKILTYEGGGGDAWTKNVLLVGQRPDPGDFDYQAASAALKPVIPSAYTVTSLDSAEAPATHDEVISRINEGQLLVNFIGHGSVEQWGGDLLFGADAPALTNGSRLPFVVAMNCLNGFFQSLFPEESLAESLLRAPDGGAIAVYASSAVTSPNWQAMMNRELLRQLFSGNVNSTGEAVAAAKRSVGDPDVRRSWILFGDPVTRLMGISGEQVARSTDERTRLSSVDVAFEGDGGRDQASSSALLLTMSRQRLVDFNADGLDDLLLYDAKAREWRIAFNGGSGFSSATGIQGVSAPPYPARLNDDRFMDVFWYDPATGAWSQAINRGDGTFVVTSGAWVTDSRALVADFDGDTRADVLLHDPGTGAWIQYLSDGTGGFIPRSGEPLPPGAARPVNLDGDAASDLVIDTDAGGWTAAVNAGGGRFSTLSLRWDPVLLAQPGALNRDARTDFVLWHPQLLTWTEALTRAPGRFAYQQQRRAAEGTPQLADLDGDGREDVVWYDPPTGRWNLQLTGSVTDFAGRWGAGWEIVSGNLDEVPGTDLLLHHPTAGVWTRVSLTPDGLVGTRTGTIAGRWSILGIRN